MGVYTYELEQKSAIEPARLFKAFFIDADNLIPKIMPLGNMCTEILEGDGGPGTIKKITFGEGGKRSYVKRRIESIDEASFSYSYTLLGGDALSDKIEKIERKTQLVASCDGGCTVKIVSNYHVVGDVEIEEEHIEAGKNRALGLFALVEAYLKANPDCYN